jgi:hypothetical protein
MAWLLLESFLAAAILIGIVWWTIHPAKKRDAERDRKPPQ